MSAGIVYEGALAGAGGTLFEDLKFWISLRVPMRSTWVQHVENNGGKVVKLEKNADYLIADHARQDSPPGSYSWRWIEESVKQGRVLEKDDYLISPASESRTVASAVQQKGTRTAFTAEDDALLIRWVTDAERKGVATSGNVLYKDLAAKYPHHTSQSWRDRWVKKLSLLPRPQMPDDEAASPAPNTSARIPTPQEATPQAQTPRASRKTREVSVAETPPSVKATRAKFTIEEDTLLTEYILGAEEEGQRTGGNTIYQKFSADFPQHTWQSWRDRWLKVLKRRLEQQRQFEAENEAESTLTSTPADRKARQARWAAKARLSAITSSQQSPQPRDSDSMTQRAQAREQIHRMRDAPTNDSEPEIDDDRGDAAVPYGDDDQLMVEQEDDLPQDECVEDTIPPDKSQFYQDYNDWRQQSQLDQHDTLITIQDRVFDLWDLWEAVTVQKVEPEERDWQLIAETLDYDWNQHPEVPDQLRDIYDAHLAEFEGFMVQFDAEDGMDEDNDEMIEAAQLPFNSSPPRRQSPKRTFEDTALSHVYPESSRKRPKVSRDSEIPSTPDAKNGTEHLRAPTSAAVSTPDRRLAVLPRSSYSDRKGKRVAIAESQTRARPTGSPSATGPQQAAQEPETQYFSFPPDPQNTVYETELEDMQEDSQSNITPSQQLRQEFAQRSSEQPSPTPARTKPPGSMPTSTRKRIPKPPFQMDASDDDDFEELVPKPRFGKGPNPLRSNSEITKGAKRRSLPASYDRISPPRPAARPRMSMPAPSRPSPPREAPSRAPAPAPAPRPQTRAEKLAALVEYFVSLGYPEHIARRALEATCWRLGLAGEMMEKLKSGEPLPANYEGVWTQRDDEGLKLIDSLEGPQDEKEKRRRAKETRRLERKHGEEGLRLRRMWFVTRAEL